MKHITKICICLLCVMSVFLYSSISHASSMPTNVYIESTKTMNLIDSQVTSTDGPSTVNVYTYESIFTPQIIGSAYDGYVNGFQTYNFDFSVSLPTGFQNSSINIEVIPNNTEYIYTYYQESAGNATRVRLITYFNNAWSGNAFVVNLAQIKYRISIYSQNSIGMSSAVLCTASASLLVNSTDFTAVPVTGQGQGLILKQAITDALHDGELDLVYDFLVLWKTTQDGYLADIELSVDDIETWLSYINSVQVSQDNKLELIRQLVSTFPSYSSQMLQYMQQILAMNASQAAQAASNAAAQATQAQQASQAMAAANDFAKPNIGAMNIDPLDYVSADGFSGVSYILGSILNIPTILSMLLICVTCAFIGYALYGKKG